MHDGESELRLILIEGTKKGETKLSYTKFLRITLQIMTLTGCSFFKTYFPRFSYRLAVFNPDWSCFVAPLINQSRSP